MSSSLFDDLPVPPTAGPYGRFPSPPAQRHSATSVAAAEAVKPAAGRLRAEVLAAIRRAGRAGLTDAEGQAATGIGGDTWRPRRRELQDAGLIRDSGKRRTTGHGREAVVWVVTDKGNGGAT